MTPLSPRFAPPNASKAPRALRCVFSLWVLSAAWFASHETGHAQSEDPDAGRTMPADVLALSLEDALLVALRRPEVVEARQVRAARADADADVHRWVGNPSLQLQVGRRRVPSEDAGPEIQATLLQGFALGRVGAARLDAMRSELRVLDAEGRMERWSAALDAGEAWHRLFGAERRHAIVVASVALAEQRLEQLSRGRALASATQMAVDEARRLLGEQRLEVVLAEREVRDAALELAHATALHGPRRLATTGDAPPVRLPDLEALRVDEQVLAQLPSLEVQQALVHVAEMRQRELERATRGSGAAGVFVERDSPRGIVLAGVVQLNFGFVDRNGRARAQAAESVARAEAQQIRAHHQAHVLFHAAIDAVELNELASVTHRTQVLEVLGQRLGRLERGLLLAATTQAEVLGAALDCEAARAEQELLDASVRRARLRLRLMLDAAFATERSRSMTRRPR